MIVLIDMLFLITALVFYLIYQNAVLSLCLVLAAIFFWVDLYYEDDISLLMALRARYTKKH